MAVLTAAVTVVLAALRRARTRLKLVGKGRFLSSGGDLHLGAGTRIWAPDSFRFGRGVYVGKDCSLETNAQIGDYCLLANRVAFVGRHDHDLHAVGYPIRFAPWIGDPGTAPAIRDAKVVLEADVWLGYGVIVLTGVTIGRGAVVGSGSVVTRDLPPYSISAGVPARVISRRFSPEQISAHEHAVATGEFRSSERGRPYFRVEPGREAAPDNAAAASYPEPR